MGCGCQQMKQLGSVCQQVGTVVALVGQSVVAVVGKAQLVVEHCRSCWSLKHKVKHNRHSRLRALVASGF